MMMHGVTQERVDALLFENRDLRAKLHREMAEAAVAARHFMGHQVLLDSIKNYNLIGLNFPTCACKYCVEFGGVPAPVDEGVITCRVYNDVFNYMCNHNMTHAFLDGPEIVNTPFDEELMFFKGDPLSFRWQHIVFYEPGNVYKFKYGAQLHTCTSLLEPDMHKLESLIAYLRSSDGIVTTTAAV